MKEAWSFWEKATRLRRGYGVPSIEGKAATDSGEHAWTRTSFNEARGRSDPPSRTSFLLTSLFLRHPSTGRSVCSLVSLRREIVFEDGAVFHHEDDFLDRVDILRRIAVDGDNVG